MAKGLRLIAVTQPNTMRKWTFIIKRRKWTPRVLYSRWAQHLVTLTTVYNKSDLLVEMIHIPPF